MLSQHFQDSRNCSVVLLQSPSENQNVIHHSLEVARLLVISKEHHQGLKKSVASMKSNLLLIFRLDSNIVKIPTNIQLDKVLGTL